MAGLAHQPGSCCGCGGTTYCVGGVPPPLGFGCCNGIVVPLTLYLTVCGFTFTLTATLSGFNVVSWSVSNQVIGPVTLWGVNNTGGTCTLNFFTTPQTGNTTISMLLLCPPDAANALAFAVCTTTQGPFAFDYCIPAACTCGLGSTELSNYNPVTLSGTWGPTVSMTGMMPLTYSSSANPGVAIPGPCPGSPITLTS